jgi:putative transposase
VRTHVCQCGCILDRDHNAAINIPGLTQNRRKVGVIHELPLGNNQGFSYILGKSYILAKALKQTGYDLSTVGRTGTFNACGEMTLYPDLVTSLGKVAR